jgi:nucleotide-binding universal stress UspA family protein
MPFHSILVPLDGSARAERAVSTAAAIARANGAVLHLVLVHQGETDPNADESRCTEEHADRDQRMHSVAAEVRGRFGVAVETAVRSGPVTEALVCYLFRNRVDLIVMTSHGRTGWRRAWTGRVANELAQRVSVPLLMLRLDDDRTLLATMPLRRILVALDGSNEAEVAIDAARALDPIAKSTLVLGRIVPSVPVGVDIPQHPGVLLPDLDATRKLVDAATQYVDDLATSRISRDGIAAETAVELAPLLLRPLPVGPMMADMARRVRADLVALTTHERGISQSFIGAVADRILRSTHCALLVCHGDRRAGPRAAVAAGSASTALAARM